MAQTNNELLQFPLTYPEHDRVQVRNFHGYHQYVETWQYKTRMVKRWTFYVTGFLSDKKHVHVLMADGSKGMVPIDKKDRILINGQWYSRCHWNH